MKAKASELRRRFGQLKRQRYPLEPLYRKLQKYLMPESGRFSTPKQEKDTTGYEYLLDATATDAIDTLGAGMLGGMTSPARPWFRLTTRVPELDERSDVKQWLSDVQREMLMVFAKSNVYQALNNAYLELAVYGTSCMVALPSTDHVIHLHEMTSGEYWLEENSERMVNTMYREIVMTASQMVEQFGYDNVSKKVQKSFDDNSHCFDTFKVVHCIEPRPDFDMSKRSSMEMPYRSVYFEEESDYHSYSIDDNTQGIDKVLLEEGFNTFPVLAPRWTLSKRSAYGRSPGMKALGTVVRLQKKTELYERATDYAVNPSLLVPTSFMSHPLDFAPGGVSYVDISQAQQIQSAFNVAINPQEAQISIERDHKAINDYFYKDLFLMLAQTSRYGRTAYEVEKLDKEKMMIMGPVLERLHLELLDPLISVTLEFMSRFNLLPDLPDVLRGEDENGMNPSVNVEYVSVLAQAQRAAGVDAMNTYVQNLMGASQLFPTVGDNFDQDRWARALADQLGVDPDLIRPSEDVEQIRAAREQQMAQQQKMAMLQQGAGIAKDLNAAGLQPSSTIEGMSGY